MERCSTGKAYIHQRKETWPFCQKAYIQIYYCQLMVKQHFVKRNKMASIEVCLAMYLFAQLFNVQQIDAFVKPMRLRVFDLKKKLITSGKTLVLKS